MVLTALAISARISLKYRERRESYFLGLGAGWFLLTSPWWSESLELLLALAGLENLPEPVSVVVSTALIPAALVAWGYSSRELLGGAAMRRAFYLICIYAAFFQTLLLTAYAVDYTLLAVRPNMGLRPTDLLTAFLVATLLIFTGLGLVFSYKTLRMGTPLSRYRGIFLISAFIAFLVGTSLDASLSWADLPLFVPIAVRSTQAAASALFYLGYFPPKALVERISGNE